MEIIETVSNRVNMDALDWDNPAVEEHWCGERRKDVSEYLAREGLKHGEIGSWPAWHVVPYVSLWTIESLLAPGNVGRWAICGDLPTDCLSASAAKHPRKAMLAFANTWKEVAASMLNGVPHSRAFVWRCGAPTRTHLPQGLYFSRRLA